MTIPTAAWDLVMQKVPDMLGFSATGPTAAAFRSGLGRDELCRLRLLAMEPCLEAERSKRRRAEDSLKTWIEWHNEELAEQFETAQREMDDLDRYWRDDLQEQREEAAIQIAELQRQNEALKAELAAIKAVAERPAPEGGEPAAKRHRAASSAGPAE